MEKYLIWLEEYWIVENGSAVRLFEKSDFGVCFLENSTKFEKFYKENNVKWQKKKTRALICCQRRRRNDNWITKIQEEFINYDWKAKYFCSNLIRRFNYWKKQDSRKFELFLVRLWCTIFLLCEKGLVANVTSRDKNFMYIDYLEEKKFLDCIAFAISSEVGEQVLLSFSNIFNFYQM